MELREEDKKNVRQGWDVLYNIVGIYWNLQIA